MKQVLVKGGSVQVCDAPPPALNPGMALVRTVCSLISSGTESGFVSEGGAMGFALKKARDPLNIEKVKRKLATVGLKGTIDIVRDKLFEYQVPGYSCAGVIVELSDGVPHFRVGDRVACSGVGYACHAEYNAVPHQLLTPMPEGLGFDEAAFVSLGAIAMQGVRRAMPEFGETFLVLGLGLVGQLAAQIARAAGCHVIACDPVLAKREMASSLGVEVCCAPEELEAAVHEYTAGYGVDGVIVCAASKDSAVTNQALDLCRKKGRVVVVGAVGMHLERNALYMGELDFMLSCSYGPGRYDHQYEEQGLDYPIGHVRWTQGRNMSEFLRMMNEGKVRVRPLVSAEETVENASSAYASILSGGNTIAALIRYGAEDAPASNAPPERVFVLRGTPRQAGRVGVAVIGAGAIATGFHLPNLARNPECELRAVVCRTGQHARQWGERYGAAYCATDYRKTLEDDTVDALVIATRHDSHKAIALDAIAAGKHVFVEKPLALTTEDCDVICAAAEGQGVLLCVGFNRRFAPVAVAARAALAGTKAPKTLLYRCNAGALPQEHWALDPLEGGGRIRGEAVHFYDFSRWLIGSDPITVQAQRLDVAAGPLDDTVSVSMRFVGGDLATVLYCGTGSSGMDKERIEVFCGSGCLAIEEFKSLRLYNLPGKDQTLRRIDKGLGGIMNHFIAAVQGRETLSVTGQDGRWATWIAEEALRRAAL